MMVKATGALRRICPCCACDWGRCECLCCCGPR
jgi:hypothetical protein